MSEILPYGEGQGEKKTQVEDMFDKIAPRYDLLNRLLTAGVDQTWRRKVRRKAAKLRPKTILDIATGTGDLAIELAKIPGTEITGVDISEGMMKLGREKIKKKGLENRVVLEDGDAEALRFEADSFDTITAAFGVRNFENLSAGLLEMHRVLKPEGGVFILEFSTPKNPILNALYNLYNRTLLPVIGRAVSHHSSAYTYLPKSAQAFPSGAAFAEILKLAGFRSITITPLTFGVCTLYCAFK